MKKILVTGGAGFIGLNLINHIINNTNHSVLNIDKLTYAANSNILNSLKFEDSNRYLFKKIDICDFERLNKIFTVFRPDIVMHLAAESHVDKSIKSPADFIKTNILGTYNLLEVSRQYLLDSGHNSFKFHHISTDEVFGDLPHPDYFKGEKLPAFSETSSYKPSSPYSASKASSDHLVRAWHRTFDLPTIITNCSNNYGPFQFPEKLIPKTILNALNNKEIPVYGNGCQIRDWLYVDDHVEALINVALSDKVGTTYNIGGNSEKRNIEVVELICAILDQLKPRKISYKSLISFVEDRPGHDLRYSINSDKINQELGWSPKESFESGIRKTVEWYISNY